MTEAAQTVQSRPSVGEYLAVATVIAGGVTLNVEAARLSPVPSEVRDLVLPMLAMFALTATVWLLMVLLRNGAVLLGAASVIYFHDYKSEQPEEWLERPARTFNNLMQVPTLFYVVALLMIIIPWVDRTQIVLAWIYVAARLLHAIVYIGFNYVPLRFAIYAVSCITLGVMWARFALSF
jgi:hypothetical protein